MDYYSEREEALFEEATVTFADRVDHAAYVAGAENTDVAWILSDRDVWYANPYYVGPPVPHPEYEGDIDPPYDYDSLHVDDEAVLEADTFEISDEDCPF